MVGEFLYVRAIRPKFARGRIALRNTVLQKMVGIWRNLTGYVELPMGLVEYGRAGLGPAASDCAQDSAATAATPAEE